MSNSVNNVYPIQHGAIQFLGREYSLQNADFADIFDDFFNKGGYDPINLYEKDKDESCVDTLVFFTPPSENQKVYIGKIVDGMTEAPNGLVLETFPAGNFLVVTSEWQPTEDDAANAVDESKKNMTMPVGYVEDPYSPYVKVEKMFECTERGHRWERWYPIMLAEARKKIEEAKLKELDAKIKAAETALETKPDERQTLLNEIARLCFYRGRSHRQLEHFDKAVADYSRAIETGPGPHGWGYLERGLAYYGQSKFTEAVQDYMTVAKQVLDDGKNPDDWGDLKTLRDKLEAKGIVLE